MQTEELVRQLGPARLPADFAEFGVPDALVALSLGLFVGILLDQLLRLVTVRRRRPIEIARVEISRLSSSAPEQRVAGLAALLNRLDPGRAVSRPAGLARALYSREPDFDPAILESAILDAARRRRP